MGKLSKKTEEMIDKGNSAFDSVTILQTLHKAIEGNENLQEEYDYLSCRIDYHYALGKKFICEGMGLLEKDMPEKPDEANAVYIQLAEE